MTNLTNGKTFESANKELKSIVKFCRNSVTKIKSVYVTLGETLHFVFLKDRHLHNMPTFTHEEIVEIVKRTDQYTNEFRNIRKKASLKSIISQAKNVSTVSETSRSLLANSATNVTNQTYQNNSNDVIKTQYCF
jgi:hypothetical protein